MVAVSKTVDALAALDAVKLGLSDLGENRVQEMRSKYQAIGDQATWHFVGHLQRNKVRQIISFVDLIHSLESVPLAEEIDRRSREIGKVQEVLVEVNVSQEKSKYGLHPDEVFGFIEQVKDFDNLMIKGLMTMAPFNADVPTLRIVFSRLRTIMDKLKKVDSEIDTLSMGMTDDFEVAIEEGATVVRIGRAIFS